MSQIHLLFTMLRSFRPDIKRRLSSPQKFQNPYFEDICYTDFSFSSTRPSLSCVYPDWFFLSTEQLVEQLIPEVNLEKATKGKEQEFIRKGAIQKELIVNVLKEFVLESSMPHSQNKFHSDEDDGRRDTYCYFTI